jgi:hypothetical protein
MSTAFRFQQKGCREGWGAHRGTDGPGSDIPIHEDAGLPLEGGAGEAHPGGGAAASRHAIPGDAAPHHCQNLGPHICKLGERFPVGVWKQRYLGMLPVHCHPRGCVISDQNLRQIWELEVGSRKGAPRCTLCSR